MLTYVIGWMLFDWRLNAREFENFGDICWMSARFVRLSYAGIPEEEQEEMECWIEVATGDGCGVGSAHDPGQQQKSNYFLFKQWNVRHARLCRPCNARFVGGWGSLNPLWCLSCNPQVFIDNNNNNNNLVRWHCHRVALYKMWYKLKSACSVVNMLNQIDVFLSIDPPKIVKNSPKYIADPPLVLTQNHKSSTAWLAILIRLNGGLTCIGGRVDDSGVCDDRLPLLDVRGLWDGREVVAVGGGE